MNDSDTIFDKILRKEVSADIVYEDEHTLAFLDIHPNHPGHTLVIPKEFSKNILDISEESLAHLMVTVQKVAIALMKAVQAEGINIIMNNEPAAEQIVFRTHVHVIPRYKNDGFTLFPQTQEYAPGESEEVAQKVRDNLT